MWLHFALLIRKSRITAETLVKPCLPDCIKIVILAHGSFWVGPRSEPCQPMVRIPKSKFGKTMQSFRTIWYANREWLAYSAQRNTCYCLLLMTEIKCLTNWYANREWLEYSAQRNTCYCFLLMTEIKCLFTKDVRTGKQVRRQVRVEQAFR